MPVLHVTENDLARNAHAILEQVRAGSDVVIDQDHRPIAVIKALPTAHPSLADLIRLSEQREIARGYPILPDEDLASDIETMVAARKPWNPPAWD